MTNKSVHILHKTYKNTISSKVVVLCGKDIKEYLLLAPVVWIGTSGHFIMPPPAAWLSGVEGPTCEACILMAQISPENIFSNKSKTA